MELKTETESKKYTKDEIFIMLGGTRYYSDNTILYVLNKVNGNEELTNYYKILIDEENEPMLEKVSKMKSPEDIILLNDIEL